MVTSAEASLVQGTAVVVIADASKEPLAWITVGVVILHHSGPMEATTCALALRSTMAVRVTSGDHHSCAIL